MSKQYTYCNVLVDGLERTYPYIFKGDIEDIEIGTNVIVPYGIENSLTQGTITGIGTYEEGNAPFEEGNIREIYSLDSFLAPSPKHAEYE